MTARLSSLLFVTLLGGPCFGFQVEEKPKAQPVLEGLRRSFAVPWRELREKKHDSEWRNVLNGLSVRFSMSHPLEKSFLARQSGAETDGERASNFTFNTSLKYVPLGYWFMGITHYHYFNPELQKPWNPDYTYGFGFDDWHPYTLSLTYSNFGGNRLNPDRSKGEHTTRFERGTLSLGWKFKLPQPLADIMVLKKETPMGGRLSYKLTPRFQDGRTQEVRKYKETLSLSLRFPIWGYWYANLTATHYLHPDQKQPWDPDYTYGFGFFDWHPGTLSIQYNNYAANQYPWRADVPGRGRFGSGGLSISWGWSF